jgi:hypothetical protein
MAHERDPPMTLALDTSGARIVFIHPPRSSVVVKLQRQGLGGGEPTPENLTMNGF